MRQIKATYAKYDTGTGIHLGESYNAYPENTSAYGVAMQMGNSAIEGKPYEN